MCSKTLCSFILKNSPDIDLISSVAGYFAFEARGRTLQTHYPEKWIQKHFLKFEKKRIFLFFSTSFKSKKYYLPQGFEFFHNYCYLVVIKIFFFTFLTFLDSLLGRRREYLGYLYFYNCDECMNLNVDVYTVIVTEALLELIYLYVTYKTPP